MKTMVLASSLVLLMLVGCHDDDDRDDVTTGLLDCEVFCLPCDGKGRAVSYDGRVQPTGKFGFPGHDPVCAPRRGAVRRDSICLEQTDEGLSCFYGCTQGQECEERGGGE